MDSDTAICWAQSAPASSLRYVYGWEWWKEVEGDPRSGCALHLTKRRVRCRSPQHCLQPCSLENVVRQ